LYEFCDIVPELRRYKGNIERPEQNEWAAASPWRRMERMGQVNGSRGRE
jgi:hypothetical protein